MNPLVILPRDKVRLEVLPPSTSEISNYSSRNKNSRLFLKYDFIQNVNVSTYKHIETVSSIFIEYKQLVIIYNHHITLRGFISHFGDDMVQIQNHEADAQDCHENWQPPNVVSGVAFSVR